MQTKRRFDFIVVGLGLAGACVALQLKRRGKSVMVYDQPLRNRASRIAAGLFNPITGKATMAKTWLADELFPALTRFYSNAEQMLSAKFYHEMPLYRPFVSIEEQNEWMARSVDPAFKAYIDSVFAEPRYESEVINPLGGVLLKQCGYVDTVAFLKAVKNYLCAQTCYEEQHFEEHNLMLDNGAVFYSDIQASAVVFCTGLEHRQSRWVTHIPLKPLKGETLTVLFDRDLDRIYNRGVYLVPQGAQTYKVGATYNPHDVSTSTSAQAKEELIAKASELVRQPFTIVGQDWGMRPTMPDRRPVAGTIPGHPEIAILNGLGTKGVSLAPLFSHQLVQHLIGDGLIDKSVSVARFYKN